VLRKLDMKMRAVGNQPGSPLPRSSAETSHEPQAFFPREKHKPFAEQQADKRKAEFPGQLDGQTCGVTSAAGACTTRPWTGGFLAALLSQPTERCAGQCKSLETDFSTPCYCTAARQATDEIIDPPLGW